MPESSLSSEPVFRRVRDALSGANLSNSWVAWVLLAVGLIITALTSLRIKAGLESDAQGEFDFACNEIRIDIENRLDAMAQTLRSGAALIDASDTVSRGQWKTFTQRLQLGQHLPGIQGIGYALLIPRERLDEHVRAIRGEGFPDYRVKPAGKRESYSTIIFLEPFSDRNLRAFGYDMLSDPVRRAAMERARDENDAALSGKVMLVQETGQDVQVGGLMYVPVYRQGVPIETIEQRRAAIQGWAYTPYRMTDLMRGTLGRWNVKRKGWETSLQVYDGDALSADALLFDSDGATDGERAFSARLTRHTTVDFAGRRWTLRFAQPGGMTSLVDYGSVWLVLFGGTMSTFLLVGLMLWRQQRARFYRDKAEVVEGLRASELRYRRLFESAKDGILILDAETGVVADVNPFLVKLLGYSREEFLGKEIWELGFFQDIIDNQDSLAELQRRKYIRYEDKPLRTADGRRVDVEFVSNVYLAGHQKVIQCNIRDITERKRVENELRASEQEFHSLAESMPQIVWIARPDGWLTYFNQQWMDYTGLTLEESLGDGWLTPFHPDDKQRARDAWQSATRHNETYSVECLLWRADGVYRWWLIRGLPVFNENGEIVKWFGTCTDTEEIKRTQENLRAAKDSAENANRAKSQFLSNMSHELRTPLNAIIGFSEMLADKTFGELNEKQSKYVDNVLKAGRHLLSLINDILDLAKVESGKTELELSTFPLAPVLDNSLMMVKEKCVKHGIALSLDVEEPLQDIEISADERKLEQILCNLLSNAVKFTPDGGAITVSARMEGEPSAIGNRQSEILISVADTGIGIKPEDQERVFHAFGQVDSSDTPKPQGTGLGLKLVKQFVELHDGQVWVESEFGKGSTFWFTLPAHQSDGSDGSDRSDVTDRSDETRSHYAT